MHRCTPHGIGELIANVFGSSHLKTMSLILNHFENGKAYNNFSRQLIFDGWKISDISAVILENVVSVVS